MTGGFQQKGEVYVRILHQVDAREVLWLQLERAQQKGQ
jgi:hypothetical protein